MGEDVTDVISLRSVGAVALPTEVRMHILV